MVAFKEFILPSGHKCIVDNGDYELVSRFHWHVVCDDARRYVIRNVRLPNGKQTSQSIHRFIMGDKHGIQIDHKDGNGLNNRRSNLRELDHKDNMRAFQRKRPHCTSKYRGVYWAKDRSRWIAAVCLRENGKLRHILKKTCFSEEEAAIAYNQAAIALGFLTEALNKVA